MDKELTELDLISSISGDDLLYIVDNPETTPESYKTTVSGFLDYVEDNLDIPYATTTYSGVMEIATSSEIDAGVDSTRAIVTDQLVASKRNLRHVMIRVISSTEDWSADGSTAVGGDFRSPVTGTIVDIWAYVDTAGTTGTAIVDVNLNGSTLMTTHKIKWDSTEKYSKDYSGTLPVLTTTSISAGGILTVDIDTNHTTKSKGLTVVLAVRES